MSAVKAWRMDRRISILVPAAGAPRGSAGSAADEYTMLAEVWAERSDLSGREVVAAAQPIATAQCRFRIRWMDGFDTRARVQEGNTVYEIQHIAELGRREGLEILASLPGPPEEVD